MSVFNGARFLRAAIDSIIAQSLSDFEFIVIDDASTDKTATILEEYADPRLVLLRNDRNLGLAQSLNLGIVKARADLIARQDADDVSHPDRFAKLVDFLDRYPDTGVVASAVEWIDEESHIFKIWPHELDNWEIQELLLRTCPLIHGSTIFRRQAFNQVGGYDDGLPRGQDYDLWLRISEIWDLKCLPEVLYQYRQHVDMASIQFEPEQSEYAFHSLERALKRRKSYLQKIWAREKDDVVAMARKHGKRWMARRYVWWAIGVRAQGRKHTAAFLLRAVLLDPFAPELHIYFRDMAARKGKRSY